MSIDKTTSDSDACFAESAFHGFDRTHLQADAFALPPDWSGHSKFDVLIIDVEPHGKEIMVYDNVVSSLADDHLVVLKCVGDLDIYGQALADFFLSAMLSRKRLIDYFGVADINLTRDIFAVVSKHDVEFDGTIQTLIGKDGAFAVYSNPDGQQLPMVCRPNKETTKQLMFEGLRYSPA